MGNVEWGNVADWVSGIGSLLAILFVIIQMRNDRKYREESIRNSSMVKYRKLNAKLIRIEDIAVCYFSFTIEYVSGNFSPYTCVLLKVKLNDEIQYFRSEIVPYLKEDKLFEFCLPNNKNLSIENIFIITKDENNFTYVKEHTWEWEEVVFKKNVILKREKNKFAKIIKQSTLIKSNLKPCRDIIYSFKVISDSYNIEDDQPYVEDVTSHKQWIKQLLKEHPLLFQKIK